VQRAIQLTLLAIFLSSAFVGIVIGYFATEEITEEAVEREVALAHDVITQRFKTFDTLLRREEEVMDRTMEKALPIVVDRLLTNPSTLSEVSDVELDSLARSVSVDNVYVINRNTKIVATNFTPDKGFELGTISDDFRSFIQSLTGNGKFVADRINMSSKTGTLTKYGYYSPLGSDYIAEVSIRVRDFLARERSQEFVDFLFRSSFLDLVKTQEDLVEIDIHMVNKIAVFSLLNRNSDLTRAVAGTLYDQERVIDRVGYTLTVYSKLSPVDTRLSTADFLAVTTVFDFSALAARIKTEVFLLVSLMIAASTLTYMFAVRLATKHVVNRVKAVRSGVAKITDGVFNEKIKVSGRDEINDIADDINFMRIRIRDSIAARERASAELAELANQRKRIVDEQFNRELQYRAVVDTVLDGIITIDRKGTIQTFNQAAEKIFDYASDEVIGKNVKILMPAPYQSEHDGYLQNYLNTGEAKIIGIGREVVGQHKDGSTFPMTLAVSEMEIDGNRMFTGVVRDLTDEQRAEQALRRSQKLDAVGQLTGGISHDFNNLLGIIMGNLEILKRKSGDDASLSDCIDRALKGAARGAELTQNLLQFSRKEAHGTKVISINDPIQKMDVLLKKSMTANVEFHFDLKKDLWLTVIDPGDFTDSLTNLVINARDAMPQGGSLSISTANKTLKDDHIFTSQNAVPGDYVCLEITDTGTGIEEEMLDKVFEPFFTTKERGKGTGLGLSMVFGFVNRSGGDITISSEPGHGTTCQILLPRATDEVKEQAMIDEIDLETLRGVETILIVDDEEDLLEIAAEHLQGLGYNTLAAIDGRQALSLLSSRKDIDLLFSDVVMPKGINGFELAKRAVAMYPGLKVLLTSGFAGEGLLSRSGDEFAEEMTGPLAADLLPKPYSQKELVLNVRRTLDKDIEK